MIENKDVLISNGMTLAQNDIENVDGDSSSSKDDLLLKLQQLPVVESVVDDQSNSGNFVSEKKIELLKNYQNDICLLDELLKQCNAVLTNIDTIYKNKEIVSYDESVYMYEPLIQEQKVTDEYVKQIIKINVLLTKIEGRSDVDNLFDNCELKDIRNKYYSQVLEALAYFKKQVNELHHQFAVEYKRRTFIGIGKNYLTELDRVYWMLMSDINELESDPNANIHDIMFLRHHLNHISDLGKAYNRLKNKKDKYEELKENIGKHEIMLAALEVNILEFQRGKQKDSNCSFIDEGINDLIETKERLEKAKNDCELESLSLKALLLKENETLKTVMQKKLLDFYQFRFFKQKSIEIEKLKVLRANLENLEDVTSQEKIELEKYYLDRSVFILENLLNYLSQLDNVLFVHSQSRVVVEEESNLPESFIPKSIIENEEKKVSTNDQHSNIFELDRWRLNERFEEYATQAMSHYEEKVKDDKRYQSSVDAMIVSLQYSTITSPVKSNKRRRHVIKEETKASLLDVEKKCVSNRIKHKMRDKVFTRLEQTAYFNDKLKRGKLTQHTVVEKQDVVIENDFNVIKNEMNTEDFDRFSLLVNTVYPNIHIGSMLYYDESFKRNVAEKYLDFHDFDSPFNEQLKKLKQDSLFFIPVISCRHFVLIVFTKTKEDTIQPMLFNSFSDPDLTIVKNVCRFALTLENKTDRTCTDVKLTGTENTSTLPALEFEKVLNLSEHSQMSGSLDCGFECANFILFLLNHQFNEITDLNEIRKVAMELRHKFTGEANANQEYKFKRSMLLRHNVFDVVKASIQKIVFS